MPRRPRVPPTRAAAKSEPTVEAEAVSSGHTDRLVEVVDQCVAAQQTAEAIGEKFLSYLLAMVIQESQLAMRRSTAARVTAGGPRKRKSPKHPS